MKFGFFFFYFFGLLQIAPCINIFCCCKPLSIFLKEALTRIKRGSTTVSSFTVVTIATQYHADIEELLSTPGLSTNIYEIFAPLCEVYGYVQLSDFINILENREQLSSLLLLLTQILPQVLLKNDKYNQLIPEVRQALVQALIHMFSNVYYSKFRLLLIPHKLCFEKRKKGFFSAFLLNKLMESSCESMPLGTMNQEVKEFILESKLSSQSLMAVVKYIEKNRERLKVAQEEPAPVTCLSILRHEYLGPRIRMPNIYIRTDSMGDSPIFNNACFVNISRSATPNISTRDTSAASFDD